MTTVARLQAAIREFKSGILSPTVQEAAGIWIRYSDLQSLLSACEEAEKALNEAGFYIMSLGRPEPPLVKDAILTALTRLHGFGVGHD